MRGIRDTSPTCNRVLPGAGFTNTGVYVLDDDPDSPHSPLDYMKKEVGDLQAALNTLTALPSSNRVETAPPFSAGPPLINRDKIALTGHSFGGATVLLAASMQLNPEPAVTVDLSGGVLSWNDHWSDVLKDAAGRHKMPIFFLQTANESHPGAGIKPTEIPFGAANSNGIGVAQMAVFSSFEIPAGYQKKACKSVPDYHCAHLFFVHDHTQVMRWIPNVHEFMLQNGVE
jgi:hypothetical protein